MDGFKQSNRLKAQGIGSIGLSALGGGLIGHGLYKGNKSRVLLGLGTYAAGLTGSAITGHQARKKAGYYQGRKVDITNY